MLFLFLVSHARVQNDAELSSRRTFLEVFTMSIVAEEENSSLRSLFINELQILSLSLGEQQQTNISQNKRRIHSRASRRYARTII